MVTATPTARSALHLPAFRVFVVTNMLAMMGDNIEHVISYWVCWNRFHSPALAGFAVVAHWLPYLLFSVAVGALNDAVDSRRLIQLGMAIFASVSLGWGWFFWTGTLTQPAAMVLLLLHGCAGVLWLTSQQMVLYGIAGPDNLASAVRLSATFRYLGVLVGPAVGSAIMQLLRPSGGILLDVCFYLPLSVWLVRAPYGSRFQGPAGPRRAVRGWADIVQTVKDVRGLPVVATMTLLAGCASFFVGNSYQAQMPGFAHDLGRAKADFTYSLLLASDAAGALVAGFVLETRGGLLATRAESALALAFGWALALAGFATAPVYPLAVAFLFAAGFFELSFSSMAQTIVQLHAPNEVRGRVLGLYGMAAFGLRAFSGLTVGLLGSQIGIHRSLAGAALTFAIAIGCLELYVRREASGRATTTRA